MQFSKLTIADGQSTIDYLPFDKGANGAFVFREGGLSVYAPRVLVSTSINDAANDKMTVQLNTPRVSMPAAGCCDPATQLGTDLAKTELRFLAATSKADRVKVIDRHIALLQELRATIENREVMYG